jgi:hypothetical protein
MMSTFRIRTIPILENNLFAGIVTESDAAMYLPPRIQFLPIDALKKDGFNLSELTEGSKPFKKKTVKEVFDSILNIKEDEKISVIESSTSFYEAITCFTKPGANNRRYRTIIIREEGKYLATLSYLDVFEILLNRDNFDVIGGLLGKKINDVLPQKLIDISSKTDCLADAIYTLDHNLYTHLPIASSGSQDVIGMIDEVMIRSLQYKVIYNRLADMELGKILQIQRQNFRDMTVRSDETIKDALEKFTQSKIRPKTLLVGRLNEDETVVTLENTFSYSDLMRIVIKFMDELI